MQRRLFAFFLLFSMIPVLIVLVINWQVSQRNLDYLNSPGLRGSLENSLQLAQQRLAEELDQVAGEAAGLAETVADLKAAGHPINFFDSLLRNLLRAADQLPLTYAAGAGDCFDILSAQGYGLWSGPTDQRLRPTVINYPHVMFLRDVMVQNGDEDKPVWISEAGWNTVPEEMNDPYGRVDAEDQASQQAKAQSQDQ